MSQKDEKPRFEILAKVLHRLKEDNPVTLTPCGLKLVACTKEGIKEIDGFEDLCLRDKFFVVKTVADMHQDIFTKYKEVTAKRHAEAQEQAQGMKKIIEAAEGSVPNISKV